MLFYAAVSLPCKVIILGDVPYPPGAYGTLTCLISDLQLWYLKRGSEAGSLFQVYCLANFASRSMRNNTLLPHLLITAWLLYIFPWNLTFAQCRSIASSSLFILHYHA
jgi:hypothetical protein